MSQNSAPARLLGVLVPVLFLTSACSRSPSPEAGITSPDPELTLFATATETETVALPTSVVTQAPTPTSTPQIYTIAAGDTLVGIAERFGVTLDALLAANPGVDARFLGLGQQIFVPAASGGDGETNALATPEALPLEINEPACYASAAGEVRCLLLVTNTEEELVEALAGRVQLVSADGVALDSTEATAPLNILAPGAAMPLVAYWPDPPSGWTHAQAQLLSGYAVGDPTRYLGATLADGEIEISASGLSSHAAGEVQLPAGANASLIWVLAVAYDANENVVGVRRWESAGEEITFDLWVYSLGGAIERVDLLVEARP